MVVRQWPRLTLWYLLIMTVTAPLGVSVAGVAYTNHAQREADKRWHDEQKRSEERLRTEQRRNDMRMCRLLSAYEDRGQDAGKSRPTTAYGQRIRDEMRAYARSLGCPESPQKP